MPLPDPRRQTAARIKRTEAYAAKIQRMFSQTVNELLALPLSKADVGNGTMYSFDAETERVQRQVEQLLRRLQAAATFAVQKGVSLEWEEANKAADAIIQSQFSKKALASPQMKGWNARNHEAMQQFINRSDSGMNLSNRIWQSCRQLRDEMEVALTVSIGEGEDAGTISRRVRQYLNDPDLMFRRFRYKDENGRWQSKWKKRIKDPDRPGKYKFIDYDKDSYKDTWTGKGYYKSSAQNAMRVARTETNIAYRRADHERWQGLDFVIGQRVQLSRNHPCTDICDNLAGDYPKDFVFDGWHPQCFCFVTPILIAPEEMAKMNEAFVRGEEYTPKGEQITEYPQGFKDFCIDNADKIRAAQQRGTEPYFVRNNAEIIEGIINLKEQKQSSSQQPELTIAEKAKLRHDARTPEQIADIQQRWDARLKENWSANIDSIVNECKSLGIDPSSIEKLKSDIQDKEWDTSTQKKAQEMLDDVRKSFDAFKTIQASATPTKLNDILDELNKEKIATKDIALLPKILNETEIIDRLGGGDITTGSCSSLAFAFAGNRCGFDVLDFRGGSSLDFFARNKNIHEIATNVGGIVSKNKNDITNANQLLKSVQTGKEYYLAIGKHAAIVRKTTSGYEYLELQSSTDNGFKPLDSKVLKSRFGAKISHSISGVKYEAKGCIIDIELLKKDAGFMKMLKYINTDEKNQKKGKSGSIK